MSLDLSDPSTGRPMNIPRIDITPRNNSDFNHALASIEVLPTAPHTHTIINLHGRDSNASEYSVEFLESETFSKQTLAQIFPGVKWVFPTAPILPSKRFGTEMSQWFDMWRTEHPHERADEQVEERRKSVESIMKLVLDEVSEVGAGNVVFCGMSQGAATATHALLDLDVKLGGFVGFSTWMPDVQLKPDHRSEVLKTPVFLAHCKTDQVIDVKYGEEFRDCLTRLGMDFEWHCYEDSGVNQQEVGGHWINEPEGIDDLAKFLGYVMSEKSS